MSQSMEVAVTLDRQTPRRAFRPHDIAFRAFATACGLLAIVAAISLLAFLMHAGLEALSEIGLFSMLTGSRWRPEAGIFGGLPLIFGTVASAVGAMLLGALPAVLAAIWVMGLGPRGLLPAFRRAMELASALPSVVYGWLALEHLVPRMGAFAAFIYPGRAEMSGEGLLTSAVLLAVMIAPTVALLSIDALSKIPAGLREASAALGASAWQTAFRVVVPHAKAGLIAAIFFGFARAAGETMAVQMVIGGARTLPETAFSPTTTISTQIVMDLQNARPGALESDALYAMALVLLMLSSSVVLATRLLRQRGSS